MNSSQPSPLTDKRILIIEDRPENVRLFRAILMLENAVVLTAETAREGIAMAQREKPDLILMDLQMPDLDGLEATTVLRSQPETAGLRIVVITASAMAEDRQRALDAGCDGYITKPVDPTSLVKQISALL